MQTNKEIELAERYINSTRVSVFLTGKAGTGKTTLLHQIVSTVHKRCVVVAPTGVAAVNAGGVTIHSFFQLPFCPYLPDVKELITEYQMPESKRQLRKEKLRIIRTLDLLIIDEISMVRADLLDAIDYSLRRYRHSSRPFGGVQLLMIGDVHQLPPVVTERIDNMAGTGAVRLDGLVWTARSLDEERTIEADRQVVVREIRGNKVYVEEKQ